MDLLAAYRRGLTEFTDRVGQIPADRWAAPTPCGTWDVRTLVNHVVVEDRWTVPMLAGSRIEEVGDGLDGDLLGADPADAAREAATRADLAVSEPGALERGVQLSTGETPAREYVHQLLAEHLVHGWDLAVSIGAEPRLDAEAVRECARWFAERMRLYRESGLVRPGVDLPPDASDQDGLIAAFGRDPRWRADRRPD